MTRLKFLFAFTIVAHYCVLVFSSKILFLAFFSTKSHKITYEPLISELANRNHEVTVVSPIKSSVPIQNIREIHLVEEDDFPLFNGTNMFEAKENGTDSNPFQMIDPFQRVCGESYDNEKVKKLARENFDLVILETIFNECSLGLVHVLNTSSIIYIPVVAPYFITGILGGISPVSFVPNVFLPLTDRMTFWERILNLVFDGFITVLRNYHYLPKMAEIYRDKLNDSSIPLPNDNDILKNASLILSNSHFSIGSSQPFLNDVIEVDGMHMREAQPLPQDLEEFVQSSGQDGFIVFSMGSILKGSAMPEKKRQIIVRAFSKLKQKVLWKWDNETMPDLPINVKLCKWLPQQDLLGHPKIKVFITHGGFGTTTEAVFHGVPLIGIPMFGDQELNMRRSETSGFAITLQYNDFTEQDLINAINEIINEPKYKENVSKLSNVFRDQPDKPLDRAVFWVEYVLRHKGAVHLRSAARDLNFFQLHSLDVITFLLLVISVVLCIVFSLLRYLFRKLSWFWLSKNLDESKKKRE